MPSHTLRNRSRCLLQTALLMVEVLLYSFQQGVNVAVMFKNLSTWKKTYTVFDTVWSKQFEKGYFDEYVLWVHTSHAYGGNLGTVSKKISFP